MTYFKKASIGYEMKHTKRRRSVYLQIRDLAITSQPQ